MCVGYIVFDVKLYFFCTDIKRDDESGFDIYHPEKDAEVSWLSIVLFDVL